MAREHKAILLLVVWIGIVLGSLTLLVIEQGGLWILYSVFAMAVGLGVVCVGVMAVPVPRIHPIGFCAKCGYDLTGNQSGRCPECGTGSARPAGATAENQGSKPHASAT